MITFLGRALRRRDHGSRQGLGRDLRDQRPVHRDDFADEPAAMHVEHLLGGLRGVQAGRRCSRSSRVGCRPKMPPCGPIAVAGRRARAAQCARGRTARPATGFTALFDAGHDQQGGQHSAGQAGHVRTPRSGRQDGAVWLIACACPTRHHQHLLPAWTRMRPHQRRCGLCSVRLPVWPEQQPGVPGALSDRQHRGPPGSGSAKQADSPDRAGWSRQLPKACLPRCVGRWS